MEALGLSSAAGLISLGLTAITPGKYEDHLGGTLCIKLGVLEMLLSNGADMTATDRDGNTPLHLTSLF